MMYASAASLLHVILFLLVVSAPSAVAAQSGITLAGGPAGWDLSGTGTGTTIALRWDRGLARFLRPELRIRSVDPWVGTIVDYSLGVRRLFR